MADKLYTFHNMPDEMLKEKLREGRRLVVEARLSHPPIPVKARLFFEEIVNELEREAIYRGIETEKL